MIRSLSRGARIRWFRGARGALLLVLLAGALVVPAAAGAQTQPFEDTALVDEYREDIPTATGPKGTGDSSGGGAVGSGGSGGGGQPPSLQPTVVEDLRQAVGKQDAEKLEEVATSPRFGAPVLHDPDEGGFAVGSGETPSVLSAAASAFGGDGGSSLLPLFLALVFGTGALFGAAVLRRGERRVAP